MNETKVIQRGFHPTGDDPHHRVYIGDKNYIGNWLFGEFFHHDDGKVCRISQNSADGSMVLEDILPATIGIFTGKFDSTKWDELTTDEQALFLYPLEGGKRSKEDWKGRLIFTNDIIHYRLEEEGYDCYAIVKLGEYYQDGSGGEYPPVKCKGFYVVVDNVTCDNDDPENFPEHKRMQNLLEVVEHCKVVGNIQSNLDLLLNVDVKNKLFYKNYEKRGNEKC